MRCSGLDIAQKKAGCRKVCIPLRGVGKKGPPGGCSGTRRGREPLLLDHQIENLMAVEIEPVSEGQFAHVEPIGLGQIAV